MSQQLINLSTDLKRLRDEGYDIETRGSYLLVKHVPYVNSAKEVKFGTLVSELTLTGDVTTRPNNHVAYFAGDYPCNKDGSEMVKIRHQSQRQELDRDIVVNHSFSSRPAEGYSDYYHKMATYVAILSSPAQSIDPTATAKTFPAIETEEDESVFNYIDTASSRVEITLVSRKLEMGAVGIIGLGGTGSYVLDLVAKTPVREIRLFDGDKFSQHNAFRSPGAPSIDDLKKEDKKVVYFKDIYSKMHRNIVAYDSYVNADNLNQFDGLDFAFLCLDSGEEKRLIVEKMEAINIPFIDVGMGVELVDNALIGILRVTTSTTKKRDHVRSKNRIAFLEGGIKNEYARNIQIADLNALNAALAVIKWKKLFGFYKDFEDEYFCAYTIDGNMLTNEDKDETAHNA
jgi:tRNA A37 threonylcarbamoyladenosine dehydratase